MTTEETSHKILCLHCGVASEDDEMCPACGRLRNASFPVGKVSLTDAFVGGIGSWFREAVLHPNRDITEITEINPATGLPMIGRFGGVKGVDIKGNPYGTGDE